MAGSAGDPRLWVVVALGSFLTVFLVLGLTFVVEQELDRRDALIAPLPELAARVAQSAEGDTGAVAARRWHEEQALRVEAELRKAANRANPPRLEAPQRPGVPAGTLTPILAAFTCGGVVVLLGGLGAVLLLRGGPPPDDDA